MDGRPTLEGGAAGSVAVYRVDGDLTVTAGHAIAHAVKDALLGSVAHRISDVTVHVEPMK